MLLLCTLVAGVVAGETMDGYRRNRPTSYPTRPECPQTGACCVESYCFHITDEDCGKSGGTFLGSDVDCASKPCPGACCLENGDCVDVTAKVCNRKEGEFSVGEECKDAPCEPTGACCKFDGSCMDDTTAALCGSSGLFTADGVCETACPVQTACCEKEPDDLKPAALTLVYTASDCSVIVDGLQEGKVECTDYAALPDEVCIIGAKDEKAANGDKDDEIYFKGTVKVGETFTLDSGYPSDKFAANTAILIRDAETCQNDLQIVNFHTSCSKPLETGMVFASATLFSCVTYGKDENSKD
ncbi:hypothetical protein M885DRAFT_561619 [Pelagophyceae sp. CCMP2097]|nr:hypothetical protein M885DRAFT_561619 [Pelagophyceae sp. CCMP2097]